MKLIALVEGSRVGVTVDQIAADLEVSRRSAFRWISAAVHCLPYVYERPELGRLDRRRRLRHLATPPVAWRCG